MVLVSSFTNRTRRRTLAGGTGPAARLVLLGAVLLGPSSGRGQSDGQATALPDHTDLDAPHHRYWDRPLDDPFTRFARDLEPGVIELPGGDELSFLGQLLDALDIPASSQTLVFSTTSLQLSLISPRNPRAIYFNDDIYVGYIPGGRIEIVSIDPTLGGVFYIFDIPRGGGAPRIERSNRCMNCHANDATDGIPGLVLKSVLPGPQGGSIDAFRRDEIGHGIPLAERLGGWYVTGSANLEDHRGNRIARLSGGELSEEVVTPGERFDWSRYPVATSDLLAHLLHEHQAGFINRAIEANYRARTYLAGGAGAAGPDAEAELDRQAAELVRYLLFADEAPLPEGGIRGDQSFIDDFLAARKIAASSGRSLRDLDLRTRLFRHRCSYMVYSVAFRGLHEEVRRRVLRGLRGALSPDAPSDFNYLPEDERIVIAEILNDTVPEFAAEAR